jgi:hypothetical protein
LVSRRPAALKTEQRLQNHVSFNRHPENEPLGDEVLVGPLAEQLRLGGRLAFPILTGGEACDGYQITALLRHGTV